MRKIYYLLIILLSSGVQAGTFSERFTVNEMNYAIPQWTEGDERAVEVQYSFKYMLFNCELLGRPEVFGCKKGNKTDINVYFKYNGEFDFYAGSRNSGPVINRTSNPAFHIRWLYSDKKSLINWVDVGLEHRSNGQVIDADAVDSDPASSTFGRYIADIEYQNKNHKYFDTISRGADYLSLSLGGNFDNLGKFGLTGKLYNSSEESNVTWGKLSGTNTKFKDYDLIRVNLSKGIDISRIFDQIPIVTLGFEYTIGLNGFDTDSIDVNILLPWVSKSKAWKLPIFVRAHFGPMERLSDYTRSINSIGLGIAFSY